MSKTFPIGGIHPHDSKISCDCAVQDLPLAPLFSVSMSQHLGAPAKPVVAPGDRVKAGQVIGEPSGFVSAFVHSPVSGVVKAVGPKPNLVGTMIVHVDIERDGDEWAEGIDLSQDIVREITLDRETMLARIKACGVVGLGGATFPTHIKLSPPAGKKAEILILNGAECEPYLTCGYRVMLERTEEIIIGALIMQKILDCPRVVIGVEDNKPKAIAALRKAAAAYGSVEVVSLKKKYPQGGEKQLITAVTGRQVPSMALPIDAGAVVQNVGTAVAVYEAVQKNRPLISNVMTITGEAFPEQRNLRVRIGTPLSYILDQLGGLPVDIAKVISGGPMMGWAVSNLEASTVKSTSSILCLTEAQTLRKKESNCIRCGRCVDACPMGLEPYLLNRLARAGRNDALEENAVFDCIECGSCMYSCPANIPLLDTIRIAKREVMGIMKERSAKNQTKIQK